MTITIKPGFRQFLAENFGGIATAMTAALVAAECLAKDHLTVFLGEYVHYVCLGLSASSLVLWIHLIYLYVAMRSFRWKVSDDTIMRKQGIISKEVDYLELFRVVDYAETQTALQRMLGCKTVRIMSSDKSDSIMPIFGVPAKMDLVKSIRTRVEKCKHENNIFEVANANFI